MGYVLFHFMVYYGIIALVIRMSNAYKLFGISDKIMNMANEIEEEYVQKYEEIENVALYNQAKVLNVFRELNISQMHFGKTTGYGYNDIGREAIEKAYAKIFDTEDSLVRVQFVNGTHAIATTLKGILMPGDRLLAITGRPYDTICETIGITSKVNKLSLIGYGVKYDEISLTDDGKINLEEIKKYMECNKVNVIHIQRSRGYALRKAFSIAEIKEAIEIVKSIDKDIIVMVDNCYGEFVETMEPTQVGADIMCGSLIKNIGGGLCETGGYVVGKKDLVELVAQTLTCPGIGKECGATMGQNRNILQGLFMAPVTTKNALKTAVFTAAIMEKLGVEVFPASFDDRSDIVESIIFNDKEKMIKFIQGIQLASPVDSQAVPYPWDMPGYEDQVIMAAGTFIEGASIELSADGPIRPPYIAYLQGALTYESAKLAVCSAVCNMLGE